LPAIPFIVSSQYEIDNSSGSYGVVITPYGSNNVTRFQYTLNGMAPWTTTMDATTPIRIFPTFLPLYTINTVKVIAMNEYGSSGESIPFIITSPGQPVISVTYTDAYPGYVLGLYRGIYTISVTTPLNGSAITNYAYSMDGGSYQDIGTTNPIKIKVSSPTYPSHTFAVKAITALGTSPASSISPAVPNGPTIPIIDVTYTEGAYRINVVALPNDYSNIYMYRYTMDRDNNLYTTTFPIIIPFELDGISHTFSVQPYNMNNILLSESNTSTAIISVDEPVIVVTYSLMPSPYRYGIYTINVIWVPDGFIPTNYAYSFNGGSYITVSSTNPIIIEVPNYVYDEFYSFSLYAIDAQGTTTPISDQSPAILARWYNDGNTYSPTPDVPNRPKISVYYVKGSYKITVSSFSEFSNTNSPLITNYSYSMDGGSYITVSKTNPITISFIGNNTSHTFTVKAKNSLGWSSASPVSPAVRAPLSSTTGQTG
jgi:hypothetical protein